MVGARLVIAFLLALTAVESAIILFGSTSPVSVIEHGLLMGFLFMFPALLIGGLLVIHQSWIAMVAVMYSTVALALDLATIVQEVSQTAPRPLLLILTLTSSLLNFLIMVFGGRSALTIRPDERPPSGRHPNLRSPASF